MIGGLPQLGGVHLESVLSSDVPLDNLHSEGGVRSSEKNSVMSTDGARRMVLRYLHMGADTQRGQRPYQEDRYTIIPDYAALVPGSFRGSGQCGHRAPPASYAAIFDGHMSYKAAELAANRLHHILARERGVREPPDRGANQLYADPVGHALKVAFKQTDMEILSRAEADGSNGQRSQGGSTALVVLRIGHKLYTAHAGDSGAVLARQGKASRLTFDHKPDVPEEARRIQEAGGRIESRRVVTQPKIGRKATLLAMSRALGDADFKEGIGDGTVICAPDVRQVDLGPDDQAVVMASDGVWDMVDDQHAVNIVLSSVQETQKKEGGNLSEEVARKAAAALVRRAMELGSTDNATAIVLLPEWGETVPREMVPSPQHGNLAPLQHLQNHVHDNEKGNLNRARSSCRREKSLPLLDEGPKQVDEVHILMTDMTLRDSLALS
eukprot:jgi/Botrbrau1/11700/Bobra.0195s0031.1